MSDWKDLDGELDAWGVLGKPATFWWRDDDATAPTRELDRLLDLSQKTATPVALAVVPRDVQSTLPSHLADHRLTSVLQHGYAHRNHSPEGEKAEYGADRDRKTMLEELARGRRRLDEFGNSLPALVPPWNRIDEGLLSELPGIGLGAISTFTPRRSPEPAPGLKCANTHVDPIDWRHDRDFLGAQAVLDGFIGHLSARRRKDVDADEPTGLLTHHKVSDEAGWEFLGQFLHRTGRHPAVRWLQAREAFWPPETDTPAARGRLEAGQP